MGFQMADEELKEQKVEDELKETRKRTEQKTKHANGAVMVWY